MQLSRIALPLFAILGGATSLSAQATLSGADLQVEIGSNGAIQEATLGEVGFFAQGFRNLPIADFNILLDGQLYYAQATGSDMAGLSQDGSEPRFQGALASKLGVVRSYGLVAGSPVVRVEIEYTNLSAEPLEFSGREVFDADPGNALGSSSLTHNNLAHLDGRAVAESWAAGGSDYALVIGFANEPAAQLATFVRGGDDGFEDGWVGPNLASRDSEGLYSEETISLNYALSLLPGESFTVVYFQSFGASLAAAEAGFLGALAAAAPAEPDAEPETAEVAKEILIAPAVALPPLADVEAEVAVGASPAQVEVQAELAVETLPALTVAAGTSLASALRGFAL